jgi:hypothetical protein
VIPAEIAAGVEMARGTRHPLQAAHRLASGAVRVSEFSGSYAPASFRKMKHLR